MEALVADSDAVLGVVDCTRLESLAELDEQLERVRLWIPTHTPRFILAHKADLANKCVDSTALNNFVRAWNALGGRFDWCWTVGHPRFGDYDSRRGMGSRQQTVVDLVNSVVKDVLTWRAEHEVGDSVGVMDALWVKPFPDYQWRNEVLLDDVVQLASLEEVVFETATPSHASTAATPTPAAAPEEPAAEQEHEFNNWYAGVMTREAADQLLRSQPVGAFFVRRSETNFQLRICFIAPDSVIHHVPIKKIEGRWRIGRKVFAWIIKRTLWFACDVCSCSVVVPVQDIRHIDNENMHEVVRRLELDEWRGLPFERIVGTLSYRRMRERPATAATTAVAAE
jgi:hypothetical protein